jgi:uncharacterized protein
MVASNYMGPCTEKSDLLRGAFALVPSRTEEEEKGSPVPGIVRDNPDRHRFELDVDGKTAASYYKLEDGVITFIHTEVPNELAGRGIGSQLVRGALEAVRARGLKVVAKCPFVSAYIAKHPEFSDLLR